MIEKEALILLLLLIQFFGRQFPAMRERIVNMHVPQRVCPLQEGEIAKQLRQGGPVFLVAHSFSNSSSSIAPPSLSVTSPYLPKSTAYAAGDVSSYAPCFTKACQIPARRG